MEHDSCRSTGVTPTVPAPAAPRARGPAPFLARRAQVDFEELYRSSRDDVFAYVATLLRDRSAAEDVTASAFERAFRKQRSYRPDRGSARAWLFGIARNAALDELRRRRRTAELRDDAPAPADDPAERAVLRAAVAAALATLPPRDREIVALKYHAGLDNAELAAVLGVSPSNAGTLLHRAMTKLREAVDVT
jgi:RNA polymerase sigma-70 factor, ECF subfamily